MLRFEFDKKGIESHVECLHARLGAADVHGLAYVHPITHGIPHVGADYFVHVLFVELPDANVQKVDVHGVRNVQAGFEAVIKLTRLKRGKASNVRVDVHPLGLVEYVHVWVAVFRHVIRRRKIVV